MLVEKLEAVIDKTDLADAVDALLVTIATAIMVKKPHPGTTLIRQDEVTTLTQPE